MDAEQAAAMAARWEELLVAQEEEEGEEGEEQ